MTVKEWVEELYNTLNTTKETLTNCNYVLTHSEYLGNRYMTELTDKKLLIVKESTCEHIHFDLSCDECIWRGDFLYLERMINDEI